MDFIRYVSLLSQYTKKEARLNEVAKGYGRNMEKYYEEYIYSVVSGENSLTFGDFSSFFPNKNYKDDLSKLNKIIGELDIQKSFCSIIDVDVFFFGLIYQILFNKKEIIISKKDQLIREINAQINEYKSDSSHTKSPSLLKFLRGRIDASINIYKKYII